MTRRNIMQIIAAIATILLVYLDQFTKIIAKEKLKPIGSIKVFDGILNLTFVENNGAAFGVMQGARWFFILTSIIVFGIIIYYYFTLPKTKSYKLIRISLVLIMAGAIGNFIDRLMHGYVVDFFNVTFIKFFNFPVFNIADIYVVIGSISLAILITFFVKDENKAGVKVK